MCPPNESLPNLELNRAEKDNSKCEAVGCNANATAIIAVPVGNKGQIFVSICPYCISKFGPDYQNGTGVISKEGMIRSSSRNPEILQDASQVGSPQKRPAAVTSKTTEGEDTSGR